MNRVIRPNLIRLACLTALPLALAACGEKEPDDKASAAGEILPGSIDDSMLPLDTVRSQPPLAPRTVAAKPGDATEDGDGDAEASDAATDAAVTPAATPTATAAPSPTAPATQ
jgi:hypothetical protein